MRVKAAWLVFWDALWQACGLPCTYAMYLRQEARTARDWQLYEDGRQAGLHWYDDDVA